MVVGSDGSSVSIACRRMTGAARSSWITSCNSPAARTSRSGCVSRKLTATRPGPARSIWSGEIEVGKIGDDRRPVGGGYIAMLRNLFRLAIFAGCMFTFANMPARAQTGVCTQASSEDIAAAPPEQVGMRSGGLAEAIKSLRSKNRDIHGLVVLRNCRMVVELYAENVTRDHNHALYSVTKSVVATLAGVLLRNERLPSLDVPVAKIVAATTELDADKLEKAG